MGLRKRLKKMGKIELERELVKELLKDPSNEKIRNFIEKNHLQEISRDIIGYLR